MGMWFLYFKDAAGFGFYDLMFVFDQWSDGYKGYSANQLQNFVNVGNCV
jgi:sodium/potassium-transporting ATPase subunit alpha